MRFGAIQYVSNRLCVAKPAAGLPATLQRCNDASFGAQLNQRI
jgi:hypothetical protein